MSSAHRTNDDVWLVVPLFNEETVIADVVRDARKTFPISRATTSVGVEGRPTARATW